jgi:hypothetical protein
LFTLKKVYLPVAKRVIKSKLNGPFENGPVPVGDVLESKGLGVLNLAEVSIWAELQYLLFAITPQYRHYNKNHPTMEQLGAVFAPVYDRFLTDLESEFSKIIVSQSKSRLSFNFPIDDITELGHSSIESKSDL